MPPVSGSATHVPLMPPIGGAVLSGRKPMVSASGSWCRRDVQVLAPSFVADQTRIRSYAPFRSTTSPCTVRSNMSGQVRTSASSS